MKLSHAIALAAAICCATSAMAIDGPASFVPSQSGATVPGTTTPATAWKLVGSLGASAVQVAPRWLLTARHVAQGVTIGQTYTNAYGSAPVDAVILATGADLALVHLGSEIVVPAAELPALLADRLDDSSNNLPGHLLAAGRGGFGPVKAYWLEANEDTDLAFSSSGGAVAVGGDSGSGVFWYAQPTSRPVLRSITTNSGNPIGPNSLQLGSGGAATLFDARAWIQSKVAAYGANGGPAPLWVASTTLSPYASRTPNLPKNAAVLRTHPTSAWLQWAAPTPTASGTPAVTGYVITLSPGGAQYNVPPSQSVLTINGLQTNKTYSATVSALNSNGASGKRKLVAESDYVTGDLSQFTTSPQTNPLSALTYEAYGTLVNGQLKACVRFNPTFATTGVPATSLGVENYAWSNKATLMPLGTASFDYCNVTPGVSASFFLAPWNHLTPGPSTLINITPPTVVTGEPTNLTTKGLVIDGDYFLNTKWTKPNPPQPTATLNGYNLTIGCNDDDGISRYKLEVPLAANITNWTVSMVPPGSECSVILTAKWSRAIPKNWATARGLVPQ